MRCWYYKEILIDLKEAEKRILKLGFKPTNRGWRLSLRGDGFLRVSPSDGYMKIYQENNSHHVTRTRTADVRTKWILKKLNKHYKLVLILKKFLKI